LAGILDRAIFALQVAFSLGLLGPVLPNVAWSATFVKFDVPDSTYIQRSSINLARVITGSYQNSSYQYCCDFCRQHQPGWGDHGILPGQFVSVPRLRADSLKWNSGSYICQITRWVKQDVFSRLTQSKVPVTYW